ncbi:KpsF/GutQ family sugar-phosphate isomerase [Sphingomonas sp. RS6]
MDAAAFLLNSDEKSRRLIGRGIDVVNIEQEALAKLAESLDERFASACETILAVRGRVVITGMGKSGHIGRKFAATLSATGTPSSYVHPAEAAHGDLGMLVPGDVLVVISNSGNTTELRPFLQYARAIEVPVIGIASRLESLVMQFADVKLAVPAMREACAANIAPTTSTTMQLALCDAIAMAVMDTRGFSRDGMKALHPGGAIGLRLTSVGEVMHGPARLPLVKPAEEMKAVISVMTVGGFGIAGVVDPSGALLGVITDGDIRRHFDGLQQARAEGVMSRAPKIIAADVLAEDALRFLHEQKITCAFVCEECDGHPRPIGIVHVHDFLRMGLA